MAILIVNVVNELIKVARRLIVEETATQAEKIARQRAALSLLLAPLSYFRSHMTGNIPVSYTHLDVYKRQQHLLGTLCAGELSERRPPALLHLSLIHI